MQTDNVVEVVVYPEDGEHFSQRIKDAGCRYVAVSVNDKKNEKSKCK